MGASEWTLNKGSPGILYPHSLRKGKPVTPLLLLCLSVHPPGQATGPRNCVMEGVGSSQPLAQGSHPRELNLQFPLQLHPELSALSIFLKTHHPPPPYTLYPRHH